MLLDCDSIQETVTRNKLNLVYFGDQRGVLFDTFWKIAMDNEQYKFWHASGECAPAFGAEFKSLSIFRSFDQSPVHLGKLDRDPDTIKSWMARTALPSLIKFGNEFVEPVFKRGLPSLILYTNDEGAAYSNVFKEASDALSNEIMFVQTGCQKGI